MRRQRYNTNKEYEDEISRIDDKIQLKEKELESCVFFNYILFKDWKRLCLKRDILSDEYKYFKFKTGQTNIYK